MTDDPEAASSRHGDDAGIGLDDVCFVIGRPRSGTTVFRKMLATHPGMFDLGEIFNESNSNSYFHFLRRLQVRDPNALLPSRSIDNFLAYMRRHHAIALEKRPNGRIAVLDVKYDQAHLLCVPWWNITSLPRLFSLIRERGWRVIDIHRQNSLAMLVSNDVAIATGIYHSRALADGHEQRAKVHIKPESLVRQLRATTLAYRSVAEHFRDYDKYIRVTYEEMFGGHEGRHFKPALLNGLSTFLGINNAFDPVPRLRKLLVEDIFAHIENADEIRDVLGQHDLLPPS